MKTHKNEQKHKHIQKRIKTHLNMQKPTKTPHKKHTKIQKNTKHTKTYKTHKNTQNNPHKNHGITLHNHAVSIA